MRYNGKGIVFTPFAILIAAIIAILLYFLAIRVYFTKTNASVLQEAGIVAPGQTPTYKAVNDFARSRLQEVDARTRQQQQEQEETFDSLGR
jgi:hypothetical protein